MRAITWDILYPGQTGDHFNIYPIGDTHIGAKLCDEKALAETVEAVRADPNARWIGMGDMTDAVGRNTGDKRAAESALAPWLWGEMKIYDKQRKRAVDTFLPIADKCLGLLTGNHEQSALKHQGVDMYYCVAEALATAAGHQIPLALGYLGFLRLRFRPQSAARKDKGGKSSQPFTIVAHHGWGGGRKAGAKALKLEDMSRLYDADIFMMGHCHFELPVKGNKIAVNTAGRLVEKRWVALMTGTYLRGHSLDDNEPTYAEEAGYPPTTIGSPMLTIYPMTGQIKTLT